MHTVLLRTVIIYLSLLLIMRLMGKRQLGELEITDLVTTLLISEIASLPLTENSIPLHHALLPIFIIAGLEMILSILLLKRSVFKRLLTPRPTLLMSHGVPDRGAMKKAKLSCEELVSQLRLNGVSDLRDVAFAIMESNGQISVIQENSQESPQSCTQDCPQDCPQDCAGQSSQAPKLLHLLISDGQVNRNSLKLVGRDEAWLEGYLKKQGLRAGEVFMLLSDGQGTHRLYPMHPKGQKGSKAPR